MAISLNSASWRYSCLHMAYLMQKIFHLCPRKGKQRISQVAVQYIDSQYRNKHFLADSHLSLKQKTFTTQPNHEHLLQRHFSRAPRSWIRLKKKTYDIVEIQKVSPRKSVPDFISKPDYAHSGVADEPSVIHIMNEMEVEHMRQSCALAKVILEEVAKNIRVGVSTDELDTISHNLCIDYGAYPSPLNYCGFPKSICTSVNNIACHGIPDSRKLLDGDIISVDISVFYNGYHGDCAATYTVGEVDEKGQQLVEIASQCLSAAIDICHHNQSFCQIGKTISSFVRKHGCSVIPAFCGHGIGSSFHTPPNILHFDNDKSGKMKKGMIFTIEPVICEGSPDIVILEDGWTAATEDDSRSAQFENTILITDDGAEILTVASAFEKPKQCI